MLRIAESALGLYQQQLKRRRQREQHELAHLGHLQQPHDSVDEASSRQGDTEDACLLTEAVEVLGTACFLLEAMQRQVSTTLSFSLFSAAVIIYKSLASIYCDFDVLVRHL